MSRQDGFTGYAGQSILEMLWEKLDETYAEYRVEDETRSAGNLEFCKGQANGLVIAIAILIRPLDPDVSAVKRETVERYNASG